MILRKKGVAAQNSRIFSHNVFTPHSETVTAHTKVVLSVQTGISEHSVQSEQTQLYQCFTMDSQAGFLASRFRFVQCVHSARFALCTLKRVCGI